MGKQLLLFNTCDEIIHNMSYSLICIVIYSYIDNIRNGIRNDIMYNKCSPTNYICYKKSIPQSEVFDLIEDLIKHKIDVSIRDNFYVIHIENVTFYIEK